MKKRVFSIESSELYHVCYNCLHYIISVLSTAKKYQVQTMLDDICDRTRNMHLRNNRLVEYYPIVVCAISDFNLFD